MTTQPPGMPRAESRAATTWIGTRDAAITELPAPRLDPSVRGVPPLGADTLRPLTDVGVNDALLWGLLDAVPDGLVLADGSGRILLVNTHLERMFGYDRGDLLGQSVDVLLPEAVREAHHDHRAGYAANPRVRSMGLGLDLLGRHRDGGDIPVDVRLSPLPTPADGSWVIAAVREDTERRRSEHNRQAVIVADEELRIAHDLGDTVIRSVYAAGLRLHTLIPQTQEPVRSGLTAIVDDLDDITGAIRNVIFPTTDRASKPRKGRPQQTD